MARDFRHEPAGKAPFFIPSESDLLYAPFSLNRFTIPFALYLAELQPGTGPGERNRTADTIELLYVSFSPVLFTIARFILTII